MATNQSRNLDKNHMNHRGQSRNIFVEKMYLTAVRRHFSHYKSLEAISCHSNQTVKAFAMKKTYSTEASAKIQSLKFDL